jgi:MtN3 and saliva related transmembrane protein
MAGIGESMLEVVGFSAAIVSGVMFVPQVYKCWRTKETKDVSSLSYTLVAAGALLWFGYGLMLNAAPILLVNSVTFFLSLFVLVLKRRYG